MMSVAVAVAVAVTGSRELGPRTREDVIGAFNTFLLPFARLGARWVLGGAAVRPATPARTADRPCVVATCG